MKKTNAIPASDFVRVEKHFPGIWEQKWVFVMRRALGDAQTCYIPLKVELKKDKKDRSYVRYTRTDNGKTGRSLSVLLKGEKLKSPIISEFSLFTNHPTTGDNASMGRLSGEIAAKELRKYCDEYKFSFAGKPNANTQ